MRRVIGRTSYPEVKNSVWEWLEFFIKGTVIRYRGWW